MTKVLLPLIAALAFGPLAASSSYALQPGAAYGGSVGALTLETRGLATTPDQVRAQGGFATAGAVHWIASPVAKAKVSAAAF